MRVWFGVALLLWTIDAKSIVEKCGDQFCKFVLPYGCTGGTVVTPTTAQISYTSNSGDDHAYQCPRAYQCCGKMALHFACLFLFACFVWCFVGEILIACIVSAPTCNLLSAGCCTMGQSRCSQCSYNSFSLNPAATSSGSTCTTGYYTNSCPSNYVFSAATDGTNCRFCVRKYLATCILCSIDYTFMYFLCISYLFFFFRMAL